MEYIILQISYTDLQIYFFLKPFTIKPIHFSLCSKVMSKIIYYNREVNYKFHYSYIVWNIHKKIINSKDISSRHIGYSLQVIYEYNLVQ